MEFSVEMVIIWSGNGSLESQKYLRDGWNLFHNDFFGKGYSEGQDPHNGKLNVKICTEVKGPDHLQM
ncbi:hypothetical protein AV530_006016 [Patagioenas fasciata monilis]|uniref:Uncharacterized protein n=1 Tax=Patagioenas fasciata monilis TaxID=372326 RepID=A0A1V4J7K1_PATFA|nr:hypothetical protein AV530_006016 [Patagioenas fasciata monilis]